MKKLTSVLMVGAVATLVTAWERPAEACGGCFVQQSENTQVSGHRMVLSLSPEETTLWDQITYDGNPEEFAWVLPIKGIADVGLSSDAMIQTLDDLTAVNVSSPTINCAPPPDCFNSDSAAGNGTGGSGGGGGEGVTVLAQEVVGPYETVQLESTDPAALHTWLDDHGFEIPQEIDPIIDAYVNEGFNFLALRLAPGEGVDSMRPVRITTPGASPVLPLRMVAAGTGARTPIQLFILAEGRYAPTNMPETEIDPSDLVWDWDESRSNYVELVEAALAATNNLGWLAQAAEPMAYNTVKNQLQYVVEYDPLSSGYGDSTGEGAQEEFDEDMEKLVGFIDASSLWVTRLYAELPRAGLSGDLELGAAPEQDTVERFLQANQTVGTEPACPPTPTCPGDEDDGGWFGPFDDGGLGSGSGGGFGDGRSGLGRSSCGVDEPSSGSGGTIPWLVGLAAAVIVARRARKQS